MSPPKSLGGPSAVCLSSAGRQIISWASVSLARRQVRFGCGCYSLLKPHLDRAIDPSGQP